MVPLLLRGLYEHGKEHGVWRDYHPNGQLAAEGEYANGTESGVWLYWSASGVPESPAKA